MGKRVDFSGRTVITGDPNLKQDEIRVPKKNSDESNYTNGSNTRKHRLFTKVSK